LPPVGNDVIDLKETGNRGKSWDERFLDRVFTPEERSLLAGAAYPDALLWALWAAKEAAYKAVSRDDPGICSIPRCYRVAPDSENLYRPIDGAGFAGRVLTPRGEVALRVIVTDDYVHALTAGSKADLGGIVQRVDRMGVAENAGGVHRVEHEGDRENIGDPSAFVRVQLLLEIARRLCFPVDDLEIRKDSKGPGAPRVFLRDRPLAAEISLSHDGRFTAFAFCLFRS
jgi:hypothetical protein